MGWVTAQLNKFGPYVRFIDWTKRCVLPGFSPLPLYTVAVFFFKEISKEELLNKASSLAYNFLLAIFPGLIFLFTLIPFMPDGFQDRLMDLIALILPETAFMAFEQTILEIVKIQNGGLLSIGFAFALIFATNGVHNLMMAFNKSSLIIENRSWLMRRLIATVLTLIIAISIFACIGAMTLGEIALNIFSKELHINESWVYYTVQLTRWALLGSLYFVTISILYRYGPAHSNRKWRFFSAGSWLATVLAFITIWGFTYYINNFNSYNKIYGSIGTLIVIMLWLYINSLILLIGFELNASIDLSKRSVKIIRPTFNTFKQPEGDEVMKKK